MAITASMRPGLGRIIYAGSNSYIVFRFRSSKEDLDHTVLNQPESDLDGLVRFWPNTSGLESSHRARIIGPSRFTCKHRQQSQKWLLACVYF